MALARSKSARQDIKEGQVVVFFHPTAAQKWPLARVKRVFSGKDGYVRTLELEVPVLEGGGYLKKGEKLYLRDIKHVASLLPTDETKL